jgi:1-deoxy-D-xylulose-5-phosphate synthase
MKPVVAIYSTFLQRAYDQVVHDVALQSLPVTFVLDRGGLVGDDGPTHHGVFDLAYLRCLPNFVIMSPKDENELRNMFYTQLQYRGGPTALRYPRGSAQGVPLDRELREIPIGEAELLRHGSDVAIVALGSMVAPAMDAAAKLGEEGISCAVVNARFVKPLDEDMILDLAGRVEHLVTVEEAQRAAGFGSAVAELIQDRGLAGCRVTSIGIPDSFIDHGKPAVQRANAGLSADAIASRVREVVAESRVRTLAASRQAV